MPKVSDSYVSRAMAREELGQAQEAGGEDPSPAWRAALDDLAQAISIDAVHADPYVEQGNTLALLAGRDEDPRAGIAKAIARYDEAVRRNPSSDDAWYERGRVRLELAHAVDQHGGDPLPDCRAALVDVEKAAALRPTHTVAPCAVGWAHLEIARYLVAGGKDPAEELRRAIAAYGEVVARAPACSDALYGRATGRLRLGKLEADEGSDPRGEFRGAAEDYDAVLALWPRDLGSASNGALAWMWLGNAQEALGEAPAAAYGKALATCDTALRIDPNRWETHLTKGGLLDLMGRAAEGVSCLEEALRLTPGNSTVQQALAEAKAKLAPPPEWMKRITEGTKAIDSGDYVSARKALEEGIATGGEAAEADRLPSRRTALVYANYDLACVYALLSIGKESPTAAAHAVAPEEVARLRDAAFAHLKKAVDLGWADAEATAKDADLATLRDDAKWKTLIERMGGK